MCYLYSGKEARSDAPPGDDNKRWCRSCWARLAIRLLINYYVESPYAVDRGK